MKSRQITAAFALVILNITTSANAQTILCESDGSGMPAKLEFQPFRPGQDEALVMEYQHRSVLKDPFSIFNHMGVILFRGENGIDLYASEYSDEFYVTVPGFGGQPMVTSQGKCRPKN